MTREPRTWTAILRQTFAEFNEDNVQGLAAEIAYYAIFSLAPMLVIAIAVVSMIFGPDIAQGRLDEQVQQLVGQRAAGAVKDLISNANTGGGGTLATVISVIILLFGATGVMVGLQQALNTAWGVEPDPNRGWRGLIYDRLLALVMVLGVGVLLFASVILTTVLTAVGQAVSEWIAIPLPLTFVIGIVVSFLISMLLFAMIYKVLPDVQIGWKDVWMGSAITAVLFIIGKELIGLYLGRTGVSSAYGAAGSLVALLIWIYYSSIIFLLGAEFTQVYAGARGTKIEPSPGATWISDEVCEEKPGPRTKRPVPPHAAPPTRTPIQLVVQRRPVRRRSLGFGHRMVIAGVGFAAGWVMHGRKPRRPRAT
ncbi:MAG TPA: YihY/virulence factor BrkB family protein, partial [Planctomycetaceae bacterium]|nr:YihY/virulence factor BrkB family protein [Planctomycetaceae bacterium]